MERPTRVPYLSAAVLLLLAVLAVQAGEAVLLASPGDPATPAPTGTVTAAGNDSVPRDLPPGTTLISVQSYGGFQNNGRALIVGPDGEVLWEYDPPDTRVFDAELLANGNVLVATARFVPAEECPREYRNTARYSNHCVRNRVVELAPDGEAVWEHAWYDAFIHWHEVHDVDRLASGETAVIDMGNNRAFTVDREGGVTWSWSAEEHIGEGTSFQERFGGPEKSAPEGDWTHMNDVDRLANGNFQLSIRNFDVVIEVDPGTNEIVGVWGRPGRKEVLDHQHNPQRLPGRGTLLVADSGNDRVVELAPDGEAVWAYGGPGLLNWPRDADRLPNGNTLVVDTYNNRVIEVTPGGEVVWSHRLVATEGGERMVGLPYAADRVVTRDGRYLPEERARFGPGANSTPDGTVMAGPDGRTARDDPLVATIQRIEAWASFYFPPWVEFPELVTLALLALLAPWLAVELALYGWRTRRG